MKGKIRNKHQQKHQNIIYNYRMIGKSVHSNNISNIRGLTLSISIYTSLNTMMAIEIPK